MQCITCHKFVQPKDKANHKHKDSAQYAEQGAVVLKCCICFLLCFDRKSMKEHHANAHPKMIIHFEHCKVSEPRKMHQCGLCKESFVIQNALKMHLRDVHQSTSSEASNDDDTLNGKTVNALTLESPNVGKTNQDVKKAPETHTLSSQRLHLISSRTPIDLKPWQCGLCEYKSMLQPEVVEHCTKLHHSKMQFKCAYCPYKASNEEPVARHQARSHPESAEDIFYCYYRDGSIPDENGVPRWQKQRQNQHAQAVVKTALKSTPTTSQQLAFVSPSTSSTLLPKSSTHKELNNDLENIFGPLGEPVEMQYCCPMCKNLERDATRMRDHLETELSEIRYCCSECTQKFVTAQFHCSSDHAAGEWTVGAPRDPSLRRAWIEAVINHQASLLHTTDSQPTGPEDNSLLVVRYEVPTPQVRDLVPRRKRLQPSPLSGDYSTENDDSPLNMSSGRPELVGYKKNKFS